MKRYLLFILLIIIATIACNDDSIIEPEFNSYSKITFLNKSVLNDIDEIENTINFEPNNPLPACLSATLIDSFIYYANEFTNYLYTEANQPLLLDSLQLINLANNSQISSLEDFYFFVSTTFSIPIEVVIGFSIYSAKILPLLERETEEYHPIASRYYHLIKAGCLNSIFPNEMFEGSEIPVFFRKKCSFWKIYGSLVGLVASAYGAVAVTTYTVGTGIAVGVSLAYSAYSYGSALADCL